MQSYFWVLGLILAALYTILYYTLYTIINIMCFLTIHLKWTWISVALFQSANQHLSHSPIHTHSYTDGRGCPASGRHAYQ